MREQGKDDACPECGLSVERSLVLGQRLHDSRPGWIRSLAWGAGLLLMAHLMLPVAWAASTLWPGWMPPIWQTSALGYTLVYLSGSLACVLAAVLLLIGCWLLTRPENPYARAQSSTALSLVLRVCAAAPLLWALAQLATDLLDMRQTAAAAGWVMRPRWHYQLREWAIWALLLYIPCPLCQLVLLRRLAVRVLNRRLLEHVMIVGIGYPLATLLLLIGVSILGSSRGAYSVLNNPVGYILMLLALVMPLLFALWAMVLYAMCVRAFAAAARQARTAWASADHSVTTDHPPAAAINHDSPMK